jgi:branched-chain amino acid transport system substrate-binding protein
MQGYYVALPPISPRFDMCFVALSSLSKWTGKRPNFAARSSTRSQKTKLCMNKLNLFVAIAAASLVGLLAKPARAEDQELKIGVVAAESGSFVSAGNTIVAAAKLAAQQINDAGGIKVGGKTYKIKLYIRDNRTDVNVTIASARELVDDIGVKAIWGTETHDFSVSMAKITGAAKVIQFSGNSSLGAVLDNKSVAPGG